MTTNSSTAAATEAGTVRIGSGRTARARRSTVTSSTPVVRYADSAGRARTATDDVAATFVALTAFDLDRDHGVALIEAAGRGVRILVAVTVDQHDTAFGDRPWPVASTDEQRPVTRIDAIRAAVGGQWYELTRVQMASGERRRFARQYNGYGDGPADVREASMMFGCAWSSVPVVGWSEAELDDVAEADAERAEYDDRMSAEHEQALINGAEDESTRVRLDAIRAAVGGQWYANGKTPELDDRGRFMYAENGDQSGSRTPDPPHAASAGPAADHHPNRTDPQT